MPHELFAPRSKCRARSKPSTAAGQRPIAIGVGVNTGQAVVGYMGSTERHEYTAIGDSVNTAARLCSMAKAGEILASESSIRSAGGRFASIPLPVAQVRGKEKSVQVYRVTGLDGFNSGE